VYQFLLNLRLESNLIATLLLARYAGCKAGSKSDSFEFVLSFGLLLGVFQKAVEIDRCHHRQMVRSDSGNGRDVRLHLDQRGTRSNPNAIEGEQRKKRREAPEARRLAEFLIETENRRAEGKPFVHVEHGARGHSRSSQQPGNSGVVLKRERPWNYRGRCRRSDSQAPGTGGIDWSRPDLSAVPKHKQVDSAKNSSSHLNTNARW
jgi:hypothetical protein